MYMYLILLHQFLLAVLDIYALLRCGGQAAALQVVDMVSRI